MEIIKKKEITLKKIKAFIPIFGLLLENRYNVIDSETWLGVIWGIYHYYITILIGIYIVRLF